MADRILRTFSKGLNRVGGNNIVTHFIDVVYVFNPGNASIFREECYSIGVEIKVSEKDLYREPLQINNYFGKTDYMFLCVPESLIDSAREFVEPEKRLGLFTLEKGEIIRFPEKQEMNFSWKEKLLLRALFADPSLPMMQFKPQ